MSNIFSKKLFNWLLVIFWALVIFYFSGLPDLKSSLPNIWDFVLRKIAHISEYAVLTWLLFRAFLGHKISFKKALFLSVVFAVLYAASDEFHQTFIFGREGTIRDVLIDGIGIIITVFIILRSAKIKIKNRLSF